MSRTGDDRPAFLLPVRGRGPPQIRKRPISPTKTFEFTGGIFHEEVHQQDHPYRQVHCHPCQDRRGQFHVRRAFCDNAGEGYIDTAVKVLIAVVLGALVLAGLYAILNDTVMPTVTQKITEMFSYNG